MQRRTADDVLRFWAACLTHVKGPLAGRPFVPDPWQERGIIRPLFDTLLPDGRRRYRTAYVEVPRKNGKSTLAAAIALYLLLADQEQGAEVVSAAADRDQASIVFDIARGMITNSPVLQSRCKIYRKEIVVPATNSRYRSISADAYTKHGLNCHGILFDEVHTQPNRELWDVLTTSTGARLQPLTFAITTAGYDRDSLCWELHEYAAKVRDGVVPDPAFLPVLYGAAEGDDWTAEETWRKANPGYGVSVTSDYFTQAVAEAKAVPAREQTFRRLHLCQWTESVTRWLSVDRWDACGEDYDLTDLAGRECFAGLDLAGTTDLASLALLFPGDDGCYRSLVWYWAPEDAARQRERSNRTRLTDWARAGRIELTPGDWIDYDRIRARIDALRTVVDIREVAIDRWNAAQMAQQMQADGLCVVPFGQGYASMTAPCRELEMLVLAGRMRHDRNPVLRWNVANVVVEQDAAGNLKPSKAKSSEKIDGVVALVMALGRAMLQPTLTTGGIDFWD